MTELQIEKLRDIAQGLNTETRMLIMGVCFERDKLKAERDAAVADLAAVFGKIECVRQAFGIDNADADNALAELCGEYCAACGKMCYKEGLAFRCDNFRWRGATEGGGTE